MANAPELVTESGYLHSERDKLINFLKQYANIALAGTRGEPPRKYELISPLNLVGVDLKKFFTKKCQNCILHQNRRILPVLSRRAEQ